MRLKRREKRKRRRNWKSMTRKRKNMTKKKNKSQKRSQKKKYKPKKTQNQKMIKLWKMRTLNPMNMIVIMILKVTIFGVKRVLIGNFIMKKINKLMKVDYRMNHMIYLIKNK